MEQKVTLEGGFGLKFQLIPQGLRDTYGQPPFSVLDARQGAWQARKRKWLALGIQSEIGRGENVYTFAIGNKKQWEKGLLYKDKVINIKKEKSGQNSGTSIFDPVLCELIYNWFCPNGGDILDPFCGGSVRGIVAGFLRHDYIGFDLRKEQIESNEFQLEQVNQVGCISNSPKWICDDSNNMSNYLAEQQFDLVFSCPPYGDLEVYSDHPNDLSNKQYDKFLELYDEIIQKSCQNLRNNRFACFVVANFRDKSTGFYHDLVGDTVYSFKQAGLNFYNEMVLVNSIGTLPIRVGKQFREFRKVGKTHQNILVFYKGDNHKDIRNIQFIKQEEFSSEETNDSGCDSES